MAKTKGQIGFEKAQSNLKKRIASAEKAGFEIKANIKEITRIKYSSISSQKAASLRKSINEITTSYIRSSKNIESYTTKEGTKLTPDEYREEIIQAKSSALRLANQKLTPKIKEYTEDAKKRGEELSKKAKNAEKKGIKREEFDELKSTKIMKQDKKDYYAVANFLKGSISSLDSAIYGPNQVRFAHIIDFMKKMNYHDAAAVINEVDKLGLNLIDQVFQSEFFDLDSDDSILAKDVYKLEELLKDYGYKSLSDETARRYSGEIAKSRRRKLKMETELNEQIKAYNKSVWLSRQK